jgi:hypothetical protein
MPEELTGELEKAIRNGRNLQKIVAEAGRRYALARKRERSLHDGK